ncbi:MAG: OmpA family protein, partial [Flavobacteriales bacterium]|nr:OmpA family protein [Flavobacteriales bacterium]
AEKNAKEAEAAKIKAEAEAAKAKAEQDALALAEAEKKAKEAEEARLKAEAEAEAARAKEAEEARLKAEKEKAEQEALARAEKEKNNIAVENELKNGDSKEDKWVLEKILYFGFDKYNLTNRSQIDLDSIVTTLKKNPMYSAKIEGHTDALGPSEYNLVLSKRRAKAAIDYLRAKGIQANRLSSVGYGEERPIAPNKNPDGSDNPQGRKMNRRTIVKIIF